jgi:hypothetical protein
LFDASGVLSCRPEKASKCRLGASFKGGHNDEPHNHNDLGSYSIVVDDTQVIGDAGGPTLYTGQMFSPERYQYKILNSFGHPVPVVNKTLQSAGRKFEAKILKTSFTDDVDDFVLDLRGGYEVKELRKLVRSFRYDRTGSGAVEIIDDFEFETALPFEVGLTTHGTVATKGEKQLLISHKGKSLLVTIECPGPIRVTTETIEVNAPKYLRIGIVLENDHKKGTVKMRFEPN